MLEGQKGTTMRRRLAQTFLVLLFGGLGATGACSNGNSSGPASGSGNGGAGGGGKAGSTTGGDAAGAASSPGGASTNNGGVPQDGGAGNRASQGGAPSAGDGGAAGARPEPMPGPPDLITSSGGPWPDSLTGACSNTTKAIVCPQKADAFFGQDGTYRINVPKYTTTSTTMTDSMTSLVWQLKPEPAAKTQAAAVTYCEVLNLAGQIDWRLPTRLEYVSVLDEGFGAGYAMPPGVPIEATGTFWTASASGTTADGFFVMDDKAGAWTVAIDTSTFGARCVRGAGPSGALSVDTDVTIDKKTNLAWQSTQLDETSRTWQEALDYCETLTHAGKDDWRLPSIKELATIVDETALTAPVISADFGGGMAGAGGMAGSAVATRYWSSTPAPSFGSERFAFALETAFGISPSLKMTDSAAAARCVRTAN
jgi:hypothetical protein